MSEPYEKQIFNRNVTPETLRANLLEWLGTDYQNPTEHLWGNGITGIRAQAGAHVAAWGPIIEKMGLHDAVVFIEGCFNHDCYQHARKCLLWDWYRGRYTSTYYACGKCGKTLNSFLAEPHAIKDAHAI